MVFSFAWLDKKYNYTIKCSYFLQSVYFILSVKFNLFFFLDLDMEYKILDGNYLNGTKRFKGL